MNTMDHVNYDDVSEGVRRFCAERLYELEKSLRPLVDGTFGEVLPGHLAAYLSALRQLGALYQTTKAPRALQDLVPMAKVQEILAGMAERHALEVAAAVAAAEERVRHEISQGSKRSIEGAKTTVLTRLMDLEKRAS